MNKSPKPPIRPNKNIILQHFWGSGTYFGLRGSLAVVKCQGAQPSEVSSTRDLASGVLDVTTAVDAKILPDTSLHYTWGIIVLWYRKVMKDF